MTMHKVLHLRDDADRLYVTRKEGGRGLTSIEDSVDTSILRLRDYIQKSKERLITAASSSTENMTINNKKQKWEEKQLYRYFERKSHTRRH